MYAVIDIGSNTIRMVLYKVVNGNFGRCSTAKEPAGLVGYVENGRLTGEGIDKLTDTLSHFKLILESVRVKRCCPLPQPRCATSKTGTKRSLRCKKTCGWRVRVLSGLEEAMCDYYGASRLFHTADGLLCDVGGGSTELVFFKDNKGAAGAVAAIGSLNMFTAHVRTYCPAKGSWRRSGGDERPAGRAALAAGDGGQAPDSLRRGRYGAGAAQGER